MPSLRHIQGARKCDFGEDGVSNMLYCGTTSSCSGIKNESVGHVYLAPPFSSARDIPEGEKDGR